jgi:predicted RNA-binding Zn-ribbon protein involved in translation (DUF1610 family)
MVMPNTEGKARNSSRIIRIGGYFLLIGTLVGIMLGAYAMFNPRFFLIFLNISEFEAPSFFLAMYLPSLVVIVGVGYVFATRSKLSNLGIRHTTIVSTLSVLCLTLASLSVFNILAAVGAIIALVAAVLAQTQPSFKVFWKREASFLVEIGSMLIVSALMLFLLMLSISKFLRTSSAGVYVVSNSYPYVLSAIVVLSFLTFAVTPFIGLRGSKTGLVGILAFATSVSSCVVAMQNEFVFSDPVVYEGLSLLIIGAAMTFAGALVYVKLSLTGELLNQSLKSTFIYKGRHCPNCGLSWKDSNQHICLNCGQNLYADQSISFCPHCGRLVHQASRNCPHCGEDVTSLPIHISLKSSKQKRLFSRILESLDLSLKEFITILILLILFNFLAYLSYVRVESPPIVVAGSRTQSNYGIPLEWLQIIQVWNRRAARVPGQTEFFTTMEGVEVNWATLILDLTMYFLLAFAIVYGITKLRSRKSRIR